jgi:outer membrane protein OmpA-like peptidoglycan-associated protein
MTGQPDWRVFVGLIFEPRVSDRDGDGIADNVDQCPDDPEDFDHFEDEDGCPDLDNDRDGILDRDDQCPNRPGPIENRGCPWPDRDRDGIVDQDDMCPNEPGTRDNQGCPPRTKVVFHGGTMVTLQPIFFETAKAIIKRESYPTVDAVADLLEKHPQILLLEIQGHADERGDDASNMVLTERRAAAVKDYLIGRGIAPERLTSHGYGETKPICSSRTEACWSKNRRVEFIIVRQDGSSPDQ